MTTVSVRRIYFIPGMFGFGQLAGYDYFTHVRRGLEARYARAGIPVAFEDIPCPPTSSLRLRSRILAQTVNASCGRDGPIHLVGHSTGGLDARLVVSPSTDLGIDSSKLEWTKRVRTVLTMNTPHYGSPVASYFTTVSGTRVLYALSLLTVVSLSLGEPSLAVFSKLLAGVGSIDSVIKSDSKLFTRLTEGVLRFVDRDGRTEIASFLGKVRTDQGAIIQIMPEAMDLFNTVTQDAAHVRYGCVAAASPPPRSMRMALKVRSPYAAMTAALYSTLYQFAAQVPRSYRYASPSPDQRRQLTTSMNLSVDESLNDGVVPLLSMLWGELLWAGDSDHLDTLGHFYDDQRPAQHVDWMTSGSQMTRHRFQDLLDALARFQLGT